MNTDEFELLINTMTVDELDWALTLIQQVRGKLRRREIREELKNGDQNPPVKIC